MFEQRERREAEFEKAKMETKYGFHATRSKTRVKSVTFLFQKPHVPAMDKKVLTSVLDRFEDKDSRLQARAQIQRLTFQQRNKKATFVQREEERRKREEEERRKRDEEEREEGEGAGGGGVTEEEGGGRQAEEEETGEEEEHQGGEGEAQEEEGGGGGEKEGIEGGEEEAAEGAALDHFAGLLCHEAKAAGGQGGVDKGGALKGRREAGHEFLRAEG